MSNKRSQKQTQVSSNQNRAKAANHHLIHGIICPKWSSSKLEEMLKERKEGGGSEISLRCEGSVWLDLDTSAQPCTTIRTIMHSTFMAESWYNHCTVLSAIVHPFIFYQVPRTNCRKFPACGITIPLLWQKKRWANLPAYPTGQRTLSNWVIKTLSTNKISKW